MIRLIVDSTSDFTIAEAEALDLDFMPMRVAIGTEEFLDGVTLSKQDFYRRLSLEEIPKTSAVSVYDYERVFRRIEADGDRGIVLPVSDKLSSTCEEARQAALFHPAITVVDTKQVTIGIQILVRYAKRLVAQGVGFDELVERLEEARERVRLIALLDTLDYLKAGGRIRPAVAAAGSLLKVKPVLAMEDGELVLAGKARGAKNGQNLLRRLMDEVGVDFSMPYLLGYTGNDDQLLRTYVEASRDLWESSTGGLPVAQVGCTIGTHAGPGAIALAFFEQS